MAYIVASYAEVMATATTSFDVPIPSGHVADDLLLAFVTQDGGGTAIAASGWTVIGTQAANQAQRTVVLRKWATSDDEPDIALTGANDEWAVTIVVVRGAKLLTPISDFSRTNSANSTTPHLDSGSPYAYASDLVFYCWGFDHTGKLTLENPSDLVAVSLQQTTCTQIVGYRHAMSDGNVPVLRALCELANEGGQCWVIAVWDATESTPKLGPFAQNGYSVIARYGGSTLSPADNVATFLRHDAITAFDDFSTAVPTSIGGIAIPSGSTSLAAHTDPATPWGTMTGFSNALNMGGVDGWVGMIHDIPTTDMRGKIFSVQYQMSSVSGTLFGVEGCIVYFQDTSNNWAAFQLGKRAGIVAAVSYTTQIDLEGWTKYAGSGTAINWQNVNKLGYAYHRRGSVTTAVVLRVKNALLLGQLNILDGCAESPVNPAFINQAMNGWGPVSLGALQGKGSALGQASLRLGDGSRKTYIDTLGTAYELPQAFNASIARRGWQVPVDSVEYRVFAGPSDTVKLNASLAATDTRQRFIIDAGSSLSATYDFSGLVLIGWSVTHNVSGITINDATFASCHLVTLNGGSLDGCAITGSVAPVAVETTDPSKITDCEFISGGSGHAIEITTPGTYAFVGNTFSGYGADGSADAAIYNNSGGAVTLNVSGGGDTPTVRNGAGSTTTIVSGASLTLTGVIPGSDIVILDAGTNTERVDIDQHPTSTYVYSYTVTGDVDICLYLAGHKPYIVRGYTLSTSDSSLPIAQVPDRNYSNP